MVSFHADARRVDLLYGTLALDTISVHERIKAHEPFSALKRGGSDGAAAWSFHDEAMGEKRRKTEAFLL